eukprot:9575055-Alexandrium_andersonii.AAC.1
MAIFRGCFLPDQSIVANEQNEPVSTVSKEWLTHLNDDKLIPEVPIVTGKSDIQVNEEYLRRDKLDGDTTVYYNSPKHTFT